MIWLNLSVCGVTPHTESYGPRGLLLSVLFCEDSSSLPLACREGELRSGDLSPPAGRVRSTTDSRMAIELARYGASYAFLSFWRAALRKCGVAVCSEGTIMVTRKCPRGVRWFTSMTTCDCFAMHHTRVPGGLFFGKSFYPFHERQLYGRDRSYNEW